MSHPDSFVSSSESNSQVSSAFFSSKDNCTISSCGTGKKTYSTNPSENYGDLSWSNGNTKQCCNVFVSRTPYVVTPCKTYHEDDDDIATQYYPWIGLWRTPFSPALPEVFYPKAVQPQSLCNPNFMWW